MILKVVTVVNIVTKKHFVDVFNMIMTVVTMVAIVTKNHFIDVVNMILKVTAFCKCRCCRTHLASLCLLLPNVGS